MQVSIPLSFVRLALVWKMNKTNRNTKVVSHPAGTGVVCGEHPLTRCIVVSTMPARGFKQSRCAYENNQGEVLFPA